MLRSLVPETMPPARRTRDQTCRKHLAGGELVTHWFPGRWMGRGELGRLRDELAGVALARLAELPTYGVFLPGSEPYVNRMVTLFYPPGAAAPAAFSAMVHCPARIEGAVIDVVNLGLAIVRPEFAGRHALPALYIEPLIDYFHRRCGKPFWVAAFTASPAAVEAIGRIFSDVCPDIRRGGIVRADHRRIARALYDRWRHESGVAPGATLDEATLTVRASCDGPSAPLRRAPGDASGAPASPVAAWCRQTLDYGRGDELLMIGRADVRALLRARIGGWLSRW